MTKTPSLISPHSNPFEQWLGRCRLDLERRAPRVLQLNLGRLCNQTCRHCHVNAGPTRTELMTMEVAREVMAVVDRFPSITLLDITGGAPEMAPPFRWLVQEGRRRGLRVIDRCNLTILTEPGHEDLADYLARHQVEIVASLPCYTAENVDRQRGDGMFARSIEGIRILNGVGYGTGKVGNGALRLGLVFNPGGATLPPPQAALESDYRRRLSEDFGVAFDYLITIANMAVGRFRSDLKRSGKLADYEQLLENSANPDTVEAVMCRDHLSVDYLGYLFDCDFNQMMEMPLGGRRLHVRNLDQEALSGLGIATGRHCFGCTAGQGSSCSGSLVRN